MIIEDEMMMMPRYCRVAYRRHNIDDGVSFCECPPMMIGREEKFKSLFRAQQLLPHVTQNTPRVRRRRLTSRSDYDA